jgi:uncharacterized protein (DUF488 family)
MTLKTRPIKTIGHSNHPIERFVELLERGGVELLVDVRSTPYSRRCPQFGRERLTQALAAAGITYRWQGEALGGRNDRSYDEAAARPDFQDALSGLIAQSADRTLCLMCAEKNPLDCHRTVLVSRRLAERGSDIEHLLADGSTRTHEEIEDELLARTARAPDLFQKERDRTLDLGQAWQARERKMKGSA